MANTKDYSMREMVIDRYLSTGNEFTRKEMQDLINKYLAERDMKTVSSKMTVLNDINEMNGKFSQVYGRDGIVYEDRHGKRYYRYADGISSIYNRELTPDEVEKIINVRMLLKDLHGMPNFNWIDQLLVRFDQQLSGDDRVLVSYEKGAMKDGEFFKTVFDAILKKKVLKLRYKKFNSEPSERKICPYFLKEYNQRWYMFVHDEKREGIICFALDRIMSLTVMNDEPFVEPDDDLTHYLDHIVGVTLPKDGVVEHIVLKGDAWVTHYLETLPIHKSQRLEHTDDGCCLVTLDVIVNPELEQELLLYGDHITVLEPESFRKKVLNRVNLLAKNYNIK